MHSWPPKVALKPAPNFSNFKLAGSKNVVPASDDCKNYFTFIAWSHFGYNKFQSCKQILALVKVRAVSWLVQKCDAVVYKLYSENSD